MKPTLTLLTALLLARLAAQGAVMDCLYGQPVCSPT